MKWDGRYSIYAGRPLAEVYSAQTGSTGEINLTLVAMLREAGLNAHPVLISTVSNGIPLFPTINGFNYVVASVEEEGSDILLDASNWRTTPNVLMKKLLNWDGMQIKEDGTFKRIPMVPDSVSRTVHMMDIKINREGVVTGKVRSSHDRFHALMIRMHDLVISDPGYQKEFETKRRIKVEDYELVNLVNPEEPLLEIFQFSSARHTTIAGNRIVFNPLFFNSLKETPFQEESRKLPIYFGYPWQTKKRITVELPEGYEVEALPEGLVLNMAVNLGSFSYQLEDTGMGQLQVLSEFQINKGQILSEDFSIIKEFYKNVAKKVAEPVVLKKIEGYEHQEVTTGGR